MAGIFRKAITFIWLFASAIAVYAQDTLITEIEYFIDMDPGPGNGTSLFNGPGDDTIKLQGITINTNNLSQGLHNLFIRAKNANQVWSVVSHRQFYTNPVETTIDIVRAEYFIDEDPGLGMATVIPVTVGDTVDINQLSIPTSSVSAGQHHLYVRSQSSEGTWSVVSHRQFYVLSSDPQIQLNALEYFVDNDPGPGLATAISLVVDDSIQLSDQVIVLNGLGVGQHNLYIRCRSTDGTWNVVSHKPFYVKEQEQDIVIDALEYFIDEDPGPGQGISIPVSPNDTIILDDLDLPQNLALGNYQIGFRARSNNGAWSVFSLESFKICTEYGPLSQMEFHVEGNKVYFTNLSEYNTHTKWTFGDNTMDTVLSPIKTYATPGNFNIQLISTNECAADTLSVLLSLHGLQKINATRSGNAGIATVFFEGNGFTPNTILKLKKGSTELFPIDKIYRNPTRITAYYDLNDVDTGRYDVIGVLGGGMLDTIKGGFIVEAANTSFVDIHVMSGGRSRLNRMSPTIGLQNVGNQDAIMVPAALFLGYNPDFTNITFSEIREKFVDFSDIPFFQETQNYLAANNISSTNLSALDVDPSRKVSLYSFIRIKVPSESFVMTEFKVDNPAFHPGYEMGLMTQPPMFSSMVAINDVDSIDIRDCISSFMKKSVRKTLGISLVNEEWDACFNVAYDSLRSTVRHLVRDFDQSQKSIPFKALHSGLLVKMTQCSASGMPATLNDQQFTKIVKDFTYNWLLLESLDSIGRPCFDTIDNYILPSIVSSSQGNLEDRTEASQRSIPGCNSGAAEAFPELAEMCSLLTAPNERIAALGGGGLASFLAKKVIKAITPKSPGGGVGGGLGLNTASAKCKEFCESTSWDPNEKSGPGNNDDQIHVRNLDHYNYKISFENMASATANAAYVEIVDTFDKIVFDLSTFQIGNLGWGDSIVTMDANRSEYSFLKDLRPQHPNYLRVDIRLDTVSGEAKWQFFTLDTTTLQLTEDPSQGFLPPNINAPEGQGFVCFFISPKQGTTSGTEFFNQAKIVFDENAPINTETWMHIADTTQPASMVLSLPQYSPDKNFIVSWQGADAHSGVDKFQIFVSINDSLFIPWNSFTEVLSDTFFGKYGYTYKFYSMARDKVYNYEDPPTGLTPDAVTTPLLTGQVISVKNGDWHDPTTWSNNAVPDINTDLIVKHLVSVEMNGVCKKATIVQPGNLIIDLEKRLDINTN